MGLFIGNRQVDMFSMLHSKSYIRAVRQLPAAASLTEASVGTAYCLISEQAGFAKGHIYKVVADAGQLTFEDLNLTDGGISAIYTQDGGLVV